MTTGSGSSHGLAGEVEYSSREARSTGSHCGGHAVGRLASSSSLATRVSLAKAAATPMRTSAWRREAGLFACRTSSACGECVLAALRGECRPAVGAGCATLRLPVYSQARRVYPDESEGSQGALALLRAAAPRECDRMGHTVFDLSARTDTSIRGLRAHRFVVVWPLGAHNSGVAVCNSCCSCCATVYTVLL